MVPGNLACSVNDIYDMEGKADRGWRVRNTAGFWIQELVLFFRRCGHSAWHSFC